MPSHHRLMTCGRRRAALLRKKRAVSKKSALGLTRRADPAYNHTTFSVNRATAPERKARRRRQAPVAHWRATVHGGHDDRAAMPDRGRGAALGIAPRWRGNGSWATS